MIRKHGGRLVSTRRRNRQRRLWIERGCPPLNARRMGKWMIWHTKGRMWAAKVIA